MMSGSREVDVKSARERLGWGAAVVVASLLGSAVSAFPAEGDRLIEALALEPGQSVADVGAGDGEWSGRLAERVGPRGRVFATEVDEGEIAKIEARVRRAGLDNVTVLRGSQEDTGLPAACCDAVLLRMVYHHFPRPAAMRASLRRALRPGGRLVVVDTEPHRGWSPVAGVPDRGGHGIREEDLRAELTGDGFEVVARHDRWDGRDDRYCLVLRPRGSASAPPPGLGEGS